MTIDFRQEEIIRSQKNPNTQKFFSILLKSPVLTNKRIDKLMILIHEGINVDAQHEILHSPLHACVKYNNLKLVQELILYGAKVNLKNSFTSNSVLHNAAEIGNEDIALLLINVGAEIDAIAYSLQTPLRHALFFDKTGIAKILLRSGAKADIKDCHGGTPLHLAAIRCHTEIIKLMLEKKVEIDAKNNLGETPLYFAIEVSFDIVRLLLNAGADLGATNLHGWSPLQRRFEFLNPCALELVEKTLTFIINKFVEAGGWQFDNLRKELGEDFTSMETPDEMVAKILTQQPQQYLTSIRTIERLYHNAAKMAPQSLLTRLYDVLEYPPVEKSVASSSSPACTDDEQPSIMSISSRKVDKRDSHDNSVHGRRLSRDPTWLRKT